MPSLRARFVNLILPLLGAKARFASAQALSMALTNDPSVRVAPLVLMRLWFKVHVYVVAPKQGQTSTACVLYLHGGAYVHELTSDHWRLIRGLVMRSGAAIHAPPYPLARSKTCANAFPPMRELARGLTGARSPWLDVGTNHPGQPSLAHKDRILAAPGLQWAGMLSHPQSPRQPFEWVFGRAAPDRLARGHLRLVVRWCRAFERPSQADGPSTALHALPKHVPCRDGRHNT